MGEATGLIFELWRDGEKLDTLTLTQKVIKVGSHAKSHLQIDDPDVSRVHAVIERGEGSSAHVIDLGSGRGTYVNGERVNKSPIRHGDLLKFGTTEVRIRSAVEAKKEEERRIIPDEVRYARRFLAKPARTDGSVELAVLFADHVLLEETHKPPRTYRIGDGEDVDFGIVHSSIPAAEFELVSAQADQEPVLQFSDRMSGELYLGQQRFTLQEAAEKGVAKKQGAYWKVPFKADTRARIVFGDVVVFLHRSTRPSLVLPPERRAGPLAGWLLATLLIHLLFLGIVYLYGDLLAGDIRMDSFGDRDRFVQMTLLDEEEEEEEEMLEIDDEEEQEEDDAAEGEEGAAGDEREEEEEDREMAVEETEVTPEEVELARQEVRERGAAAVLDDLGPTSLFGDEARGFDDVVAMGGVRGDEVGASYGRGGLGAYGGGLSGGGASERAGIGAGPIAIGGRDQDRLDDVLENVAMRDRGPVEVAVTEGDPEIRGQLDREIIQRVIRTHRREVRACYEEQLQRNPELRGRVVVEFVIAPDGQVAQTGIEQSALNSREVESCLLRRIRQWRFPEPRGGGIVRVQYPFDFTF